jgi:hypothetical protein
VVAIGDRTIGGVGLAHHFDRALAAASTRYRVGLATMKWRVVATGDRRAGRSRPASRLSARGPLIVLAPRR